MITIIHNNPPSSAIIKQLTCSIISIHVNSIGWSRINHLFFSIPSYRKPHPKKQNKQKSSFAEHSGLGVHNTMKAQCQCGWVAAKSSPGSDLEGRDGIKTGGALLAWAKLLKITPVTPGFMVRVIKWLRTRVITPRCSDIEHGTKKYT